MHESRSLALISASLRSPQAAFSLLPGRHLIGRAPECQVILTSDGVSRRHAELEVEAGKVVLRDLNSANGTYIDDRRIDIGEVAVGQRLKFGRVEFFLQEVQSLVVDQGDEDTERLPENVFAPHRRSRADLTSAQRRVLDLLLKGLSEKKVAERLSIQQNTVHAHVKAIYAALGVHTRAELIAKALASDQG